MNPADQHLREIEKNLAAWNRKPLLQEIYSGFYQDIIGRINTSASGLTIELGSGIGNLKSYLGAHEAYEYGEGLRDVLVKSPGNCPVSVVIDLGDGAQAILALSAAIKVAPSDAMLAGLERLFGENVAELR